MTGPEPLVVVGDVLLDEDIEGVATRLAPDAPAPVVDVTGDHRHPGGAGLAAALAARGGRDVVLVTALGEDPASEAVRQQLGGRVRLLELPLHGTLPVKTRVLAGGRPLVRIDRGGGTPGEPDEAVREALVGAQAVLVADYGRHTGAVRPTWRRPPGAPPRVGPAPARRDTGTGARLVTPNAGEAVTLCAGTPGVPGDSLGAFAERGTELAERWRAAGVAVTLGEQGVLLTRPGGGTPMLIPAPFHADGDTCGAGDCFAATTVAGLADGLLPEEALQRAVAEAAAFVAAGGAGNPDLWHNPVAPVPSQDPAADAFELAREVRARGGTVVATGGCFDLVHAGRGAAGERAADRRLSDRLPELRRVRHPPQGARAALTPATDRARVLAALGSVDAVVVFEEDTPERVLERLRPDVWVKGGDYSVQELPEAEVVRTWGGQAVVLPYLDGHSTTSLARRAAEAVE
ncbi:PfkB family carbohydrate kinase [Streptomyces thermocarboxydus]